MTNYLKQGTLVRVNLGKPPVGIKGHEQAFIRPAIVIKHFTELRLLIIVPCTTATTFESHYTTVKLLAGAGGLRKNSIVLCHQIRTISVDRIDGEPMGCLPKKELYKIHSCLVDILTLKS